MEHIDENMYLLNTATQDEFHPLKAMEQRDKNMYLLNTATQGELLWKQWNI